METSSNDDRNGFASHYRRIRRSQKNSFHSREMISTEKVQNTMGRLFPTTKFWAKRVVGKNSSSQNFDFN